MSAYSNTHPVLKLGYKGMCEVHCNGLQGVFLGGHDRDLFIQCTSLEYRDLPLVDANQGGCIMSCSNFEKVAGRELSKKWKESIHVVGEGEGSKATLLAWLKRQADSMSPDLVGSSVWVCWCNEAEYYLGQIMSFNKENGKHKVQFSPTYKLSVAWCASLASIAQIASQAQFEIEKLSMGIVLQIAAVTSIDMPTWTQIARY